MKTATYILTFLFGFAQQLCAQELSIPDDYSIVDSISGDLDQDAVKELVVVYNTEPEDDIQSVSSELIIYKLTGDNWKEWKKSNQAIYDSKDGGMMGDPFSEMTIKNGILLISHYGGTSWKWGFTDKYRYQNGNFYLIGYTGIGGKLCEYWREVDFNLSTGKLNVKKEFQKCETEEQNIYKRENETMTKKGLAVTLKNRQEKKIKITTPKYGHEIYVAIGKIL